jgi:hypothetical protein
MDIGVWGMKFGLGCVFLGGENIRLNGSGFDGDLVELLQILGVRVCFCWFGVWGSGLRL